MNEEDKKEKDDKPKLKDKQDRKSTSENGYEEVV